MRRHGNARETVATFRRIENRTQDIRHFTGVSYAELRLYRPRVQTTPAELGYISIAIVVIRNRSF